MTSDSGYVWKRLRVFPEHGLAVGWYRNRRIKQRLTTVCVFSADIESAPFGTIYVVTRIAPTIRMFRDDQRAIAKWYFKELCRAYKNGIGVAGGRKNDIDGGWD